MSCAWRRNRKRGSEVMNASFHLNFNAVSMLRAQTANTQIWRIEKKSKIRNEKKKQIALEVSLALT